MISLIPYVGGKHRLAKEIAAVLRETGADTYVGTENYYSCRFSNADHAILAHLLSHCTAKAVCTYYETDLVRELYPPEKWDYRRCVTTANTRAIKAQKKKMVEVILTRKENNHVKSSMSDEMQSYY